MRYKPFRLMGGGARTEKNLLRVGSQTVVALMVTMTGALADVSRTEAKAITAVTRTDTRTDVCTIAPDGQMPKSIGRLLELNPRGDLLRAEGEHLRIPCR